MSGESTFLHELKVVVAIALDMAEVSHAQNAADLPVTEWLLDPTETERGQVGLRGILAAITELENGSPLRPAEPAVAPPGEHERKVHGAFPAIHALYRPRERLADAESPASSRYEPDRGRW